MVLKKEPRYPFRVKCGSFLLFYGFLFCQVMLVVTIPVPDPVSCRWGIRPCVGTAFKINPSRGSQTGI
jgi:hypothetical protein